MLILETPYIRKPSILPLRASAEKHVTSGSHFRDHITHIVQPRLLFRKINSRIDGSICKNIAGIGGVFEGDDFVRAAR